MEPEAAVGFYGGVSLRDRGSDAMGPQSVGVPANWAPFASAPVDDTATRALVFGGYRWRNEVAVEASFSSVDKYSLHPGDLAPLRRGVGLGVANAALGQADASARTWNLDVYTSWAFYKSLALYGRLGYAQAEGAPQPYGMNLASGNEPRRLRDGVNYGLGLRYDLGYDLGLRLEYGRAARFGLDSATPLPEADQVSFGVQFRF
jgi:hypothetical protein